MAHTLKAYYYTDPATAVTVDFMGAISDNDGIALDAYQMGVPGIEQARNSSLYSDAPRPVYSKHGTVTDVLTVTVRGSTNTNLYTNLHLLAKLGEYARIGMQNPTVKATPYLEMYPGGSTSAGALYAPIYGCRVELPDNWAQNQDATLTIDDVTVTIERGLWQKFAPGAFTLTTNVASAMGEEAFLGYLSSSADIGGDTTASYIVKIYQDGGSETNRAIVGYRSKALGGANYASLGLKEAEALTNGTDTSDQVDATANGGNCVRCTFGTTATIATRLSGSSIPYGSHRVFARMKITGTAVATVNLKYQDDLQTRTVYAANSAVSVTSTSWFVFDMGIASFYQRGLGAVSTTTATGVYAIDALRASGAGNLDIDWVFFMPTEGYLTASGFRMLYDSAVQTVEFNTATYPGTNAQIFQASSYQNLAALAYTASFDPMPGPCALYWLMGTDTGSAFDVLPAKTELYISLQTNPRYLMPSLI